MGAAEAAKCAAQAGDALSDTLLTLLRERPAVELALRPSQRMFTLKTLAQAAKAAAQDTRVRGFVILMQQEPGPKAATSEGDASSSAGADSTPPTKEQQEKDNTEDLALWRIERSHGAAELKLAATGPTFKVGCVRDDTAVTSLVPAVGAQLLHYGHWCVYPASAGATETLLAAVRSVQARREQAPGQRPGMASLSSPLAVVPQLVPASAVLPNPARPTALQLVLHVIEHDSTTQALLHGPLERLGALVPSGLAELSTVARFVALRNKMDGKQDGGPYALEPRFNETGTLSVSIARLRKLLPFEAPAAPAAGAEGAKAQQPLVRQLQRERLAKVTAGVAASQQRTLSGPGWTEAFRTAALAKEVAAELLRSPEQPYCAMGVATTGDSLQAAVVAVAMAQEQLREAAGARAVLVPSVVPSVVPTEAEAQQEQGAKVPGRRAAGKTGQPGASMRLELHCVPAAEPPAAV